MKSYRHSMLCAALFSAATSVAVSQQLIDRKVSLDIAPQPMGDALNELARQSGVQVAVYSDLGDGLICPRLSGSFSPRDAVAKLLEGTGLDFELTVNDVIVVRKAGEPAARTTSLATPAGIVHLAEATPQTEGAADPTNAPAGEPPGGSRLEEVVVTVFGRGSQESARQVPQSIDVFPLEFIDTVQAQILDDVIRFVPNAQPMRWSPQLNSIITIRGFNVTQTWNGMGYRYQSSPPDMSNVERIEVLKGPASVLYGSMEPGAVVNIVTKRPQRAFDAQASLRYGSYNDVTASTDVGGPVTDTIRARLNASYGSSDTQYDYAGLEDVFVAPVMEFDLGERTLLTLDGFYQKRTNTDGYVDGTQPRSTIAGFGNPSPFGTLPISTRLNHDEDITGPAGFGDLHEYRENIDANARLSHTFNYNWTMNLALSFHGSDRDEESLFLNSDPGILDPDGRTSQRAYWAIAGDPEETAIAHADFGGEFSTGRVLHKMTVGLDFAHDKFLSRRAYFGITPIDIFAPVYGTIVLPDVMPLDVSTGESTESGVFFQDRISYGKLHLLAGGRLSNYHSNGTYTGFEETDTEKERLIDHGIWTPQLGILFDLSDRVSLFASRSESFVPTSVLQNNRERILPETSVQYEAGAKIDIGDSGVSLNAAGFYIEKNDIFITDPTDGFNSIPVGQVTAQGFEVSIDGHPAPGLSLYAGYGYNKTEITSADQYEGLPFAEVPEQTLALVGRYDLQAGALHGLGFTGSLNYTSDAWAFDYNYKLPSWTQIDVGLVYPVNERMELRLNVNNLTDEGLYTVYNAAGDIAFRKERTYFGEVTFHF